MRGWLTTVAELVGAGMVSVGCWLVAPAAGLIVAGVCVGFVGFVLGDGQ